MWSTLARNSSVFIGVGTWPWNVLPGRFASGMYLLMMLSAVGSKRDVGMMLSGNGLPVSGSMIGLVMAEKSPLRAAEVGTTAELMKATCDWRRPEYDPKKNVL